jgi:hypothetical protein
MTVGGFDGRMYDFSGNEHTDEEVDFEGIARHPTRGLIRLHVLAHGAPRDADHAVPLAIAMTTWAPGGWPASFAVGGETGG